MRVQFVVPRRSMAFRVTQVFLLCLMTYGGTAVAQSVVYSDRGIRGTITFPSVSVVSSSVPTYSVPPSSGTVLRSGTVCSKCGRAHSLSTVQGGGRVISSPSITTTAPIVRQTGAFIQSSSSPGTQNVLSVLNGQRARQGLRSLRYDGSLQAVAERRAREMASRGLKSHPPGSFAPGRYEGVGWSSSFSPNGVYACYTSDPNMTYAGAAMVRGRDGVYFAVVYR